MATQSPKPSPINEHLHWMFATPVITYQWPDCGLLNSRLEKLILAREKLDTSIQNSNAGGWQSSDDLLSWRDPATNELKKLIDQLLYSVLMEMSTKPHERPKARFRIDCWANVNREGDYNVVHAHPNSLWSGVYYVSNGKPDPERPHAGKIELLDPRVAAHMIQVGQTITDTRCFMNSDPGLMIMFPSWLKHMVHPHKGAGARISIAFNAQPVF